jgi:hypothetical protein
LVCIIPGAAFFLRAYSRGVEKNLSHPNPYPTKRCLYRNTPIYPTRRSNSNTNTNTQVLERRRTKAHVKTSALQLKHSSTHALKHSQLLYRMKFRLLTLASLLSVAFLSGCLRDECTSEQSYIRFDPVYRTLTDIRVGISVAPARALQAPGKIYAFGQYLFINERQEGIHVIDNSDPANPQTLAFWSIPGNVDMAIHGNYLYADQYIDLLTIDISDMLHPNVVCRAENTFQLYGFDALNGFLVDYKQTEITEKVKCGDVRMNQGWFNEGDVLWVRKDAVFSSFDQNNGGLPASVGIAGSYARFGLANDFLYTVDNTLLRSFSLATPSCPVKTDSVWLSWNTETIFPWKDKLFIGSQTGVFVFNNSNPAHPVLEATFNHATGCDPVVCDDKYAYVTIHDGTTCNGTLNQLDIIGIENLPNGNLLKSYAMSRPFGLSVTNDHLFLCDDGLKIYDKTNPLEIKALSHTKNINAYDVIAFSDSHLLLIGDDGFFQFDVSDPNSPKQLSHIPVVK